MNIGLGLIPAIFWGILPIWMKKITGGSCVQQLLGTSVGITLSALVLQIIFNFTINTTNFLIYYCSGICWSIGQGGQYLGYDKLGVSTTMPLSTAFQVIGNSLIGGWLFSEWTGLHDCLIGISALIIIMIGTLIINGKKENIKRASFKWYFFLLLTTAGYWGYSALPHYSNVQGISGFFSQSLGMLTGSLIIYLVGKRTISGNDKFGLKNITSGFIFAIAASVYLISLQVNGLVIAFTLTQMNVIVSTILGVIILKETEIQRIFPMMIGLILLMTGAVVMVNA